MYSLEFIYKSDHCLNNLNLFLKRCSFFTHIVLIDKKTINRGDPLSLAQKLKNDFNIGVWITLSLGDKNMLYVESILKKISKIGVDGVILVSGDFNTMNVDFKKAALLLKSIDSKTMLLSATDDVAKAKERLSYGFDFVITQSLYSLSSLNKFLSHFEDESRIFPSFFPFFNSSTLNRWRVNKFGINIPNDYEISQNREIFNAFIKKQRLHISMLDSNFNNLLTLF